jgi:hypothetical protein
MRKLFVFACCLCVAALGFAQDARQFTAESDHYIVLADTSQSQAEDVSRRMEACLRLYNDIFHFDLSALALKLRVRMFRDPASFNEYLDRILSQKRTDFVFIAWSDPHKSELLCFPKEEKAFTASLLHQGCIQFLKAFVDNPPLWLREGVATYVAASVYDAQAGTFAFRPNTLWLAELKAMVRGESPNKLIPITDMLGFSRDAAQAQREVFAPQAWGLVHFLLNAADRTYNRIAWDAISALDQKASLEENSSRVRKRAFSWAPDQKFIQDFEAHILSLHTAGELVREGIDLLGKGDPVKAETALSRSLELEPDNGVAWYYLGLIAYGRKDYDRAEELYLKAFQLGTNAGVINYALGVNAFASGKSADAAKYLRFAREADRSAYGAKVDQLLKRIETGK